MASRTVRAACVGVGLSIGVGCAGALERPAPSAEPARAEADSSDAAAPVASSTDAAAQSLYPRVVEILARSCAYQRCHAGTPRGAGLSFEPGTDYRAALVGVTACEYDGMPRVTPGDPERSWLWIKLTAPFRPQTDPYAHSIYFEPPADWDASERGCRDQTDEGEPLFGQRMPSTAPNSLPADELAIIRAWISAGAPP